MKRIIVWLALLYDGVGPHEIIAQQSTHAEMSLDDLLNVEIRPQPAAHGVHQSRKLLTDFISANDSAVDFRHIFDIGRRLDHVFNTPGSKRDN